MKPETERDRATLAAIVGGEPIGTTSPADAAFLPFDATRFDTFPGAVAAAHAVGERWRDFGFGPALSVAVHRINLGGGRECFILEARAPRVERFRYVSVRMPIGGDR